MNVPAVSAAIIAAAAAGALAAAAETAIVRSWDRRIQDLYR